MSQSGYTNPVNAASVAARLAEATRLASHEFWPDTISLLHPDRVKWQKVLSSRHVTDVYLLALAVANDGCFVTLDGGVPIAAVEGAMPKHLVTLA